jgi:hypothetical protein
LRVRIQDNDENGQNSVKLVIAGHQIAAASASAGATQETIAAEAGIPRQTLARMKHQVPALS